MSAFPIDRIAFDLAAAVAVLFSALMVVHPHPVKSVLALVVAFFALAICYVMLNAPFIGAIQVIVYTGAILVLFLFVLMLLNVDRETPAKRRRPIQTLLGGASVIAFLAVLLSVFRHGAGTGPVGGAVPGGVGEIGALARLLFSEYLLPFEALSVLLLAALVGAFVLARKEGT